MDVIVVASSEGSIQQSLRMLLGQDHFLVPARTLPELLNAIIERPVDVVILDEFLESAECASVFRRLRTLSPDVTCIMLTVQADSDMAREMRAKGVYDIVDKPFDKDALFASVERALERSCLLQKLAAAKTISSRPSTETGLQGVSPADSQTTQRREMLDSLRKFLKAAADVSKPERLYSLMLDAVVEMLAINKAVLLLHTDEPPRMLIKAAVGIDAASLHDYRMSPWTGAVSWLKRYDQILNLDDPDSHAQSEEMLAIEKELNLLQARVCVPLIASGRFIGLLALGKKVTGKRLFEADLEFLYLLSQQIAAIIDNARQHRAVFVQKEKFEEILRSVTSGLMATDFEGRLIVFNKAAEQILGLKASEMIGQSVQRVGSVFADIVFRTLREEESFCRKEVVDPATKSLLGISTSLLTDAGGKPIGAVALFTDLSTVKRPGVDDKGDAWQRCALSMAQQIKNPLVAIRTFTQLFPDSGSDTKARDEFSKIALGEIDKLDAVVERLLKFSQPLDVQAEPGDIHAFLDEKIGNIVETAKLQNIRVEKKFEMANGHISFDRNLLSEAFVQILDNAIEAMPSGGTLTVATRTSRYPNSQLDGQDNGIPPGMVAEISIADTGVGMGPEEMPNLFEPFHTSKVKGMGLGLAIARRIVRVHHGDVVISSESNKGTVVKVILPQGAERHAQGACSR